jgi:hypothetical protein
MFVVIHKDTTEIVEFILKVEDYQNDSVRVYAQQLCDKNGFWDNLYKWNDGAINSLTGYGRIDGEE